MVEDLVGTERAADQRDLRSATDVRKAALCGVSTQPVSETYEIDHVGHIWYHKVTILIMEMPCRCENR